MSEQLGVDDEGHERHQRGRAAKDHVGDREQQHERVKRLKLQVTQMAWDDHDKEEEEERGKEREEEEREGEEEGGGVEAGEGRGVMTPRRRPRSRAA